MGAVQLAMVSLNSKYQHHHLHLDLVDNSSDGSDCVLPQDLSLCVCVCVLHLEEAQETGRIMLDEVAVTDPHEILALA